MIWIAFLLLAAPPVSADDDSLEMKQAAMCFMAGHDGHNALPDGPEHVYARRPWSLLAAQASKRLLEQLVAEGQTELRDGLMDDAAAAVERVGGRNVVARACWKAYGIEAPE